MTSYFYSVVSIITGVVGFLWQMGKVLFRDGKITLQGILLFVFAFIMGAAGILGLCKSEKEKNQSETDHKKQLDSVASVFIRSHNADSIRFDNIDSNLYKFGLKFNGNDIVPINDNSVNVTSNNQKGGQTAGSIINNH
jgi:hypothetical protein